MSDPHNGRGRAEVPGPGWHLGGEKTWNKVGEDLGDADLGMEPTPCQAAIWLLNESSDLSELWAAISPSKNLKENDGNLHLLWRFDKKAAGCLACDVFGRGSFLSNGVDDCDTKIRNDDGDGDAASDAADDADDGEQ